MLGDGVRGPNGSDVEKAFAALVEKLVEEFRDPVRVLIAGRTLRPADGLRIDVRTNAARDRATLTLTQPEVAFKVDLELRARPAFQDPRDPRPVPEKWRTVSLVSGGTAWELFNCEVCGILPLRNDPPPS